MASGKNKARRRYSVVEKNSDCLLNVVVPLATTSQTLEVLTKLSSPAMFLNNIFRRELTILEFKCSNVLG